MQRALFRVIANLICLMNLRQPFWGPVLIFQICTRLSCIKCTASPGLYKAHLVHVSDIILCTFNNAFYLRLMNIKLHNTPVRFEIITPFLKMGKLRQRKAK